MSSRVLRVIRASRPPSLVRLASRFTAVCPLTGLVDSYRVTVEYKPGREGLLVEAYSFQRYLQGFQGRRIYQEELTAIIGEDLCRLLRPVWLRVTLRGQHGVVIVESSYEGCRESSRGSEEGKRTG